MIVKIVAFAFVAFICDYSESWSYDGTTDGPGQWAATYPTCGGSSQSPINFQSLSISYDNLAAPTFTGYDDSSPNEFAMTNTAHTVRVDVTNKAYTLVVPGVAGTFRLDHLDIHWGSTDCKGSEHTFNGKRYPGEIQFVHCSTQYESCDEALTHEGGVVIVSVMIEIGSTPNTAFSRISDSIGCVEYSGDLTGIYSFTMSGLLPSHRYNYFIYDGSLSYPACQETVTWIVFTNPIYVTEAQLQAMRTVSRSKETDVVKTPMADNNRPTQPVNNRAVRKTFPLDLDVLPIPRICL